VLEFSKNLSVLKVSPLKLLSGVAVGDSLLFLERVKWKISNGSFKIAIRDVRLFLNLDYNQIYPLPFH
jgi:hypothetical protein